MEMIDCSINENIKFQWITDKIIQNLLIDMLRWLEIVNKLNLLSI